MDGELLADQPLGQKLIKKGFWLYFFMMLTAPVGYLIKVIVSNTLSVEDVGIFYSVLGFVMLVSIYNDLGLTEALQYFLPKYRIEKKYDHYKTIVILTLIAQVTIWIGIAIAMYFGADWLAIHHFKSPEAAQILKTLCFYFIGVNIIQVLASIYYAFQDVKRYGRMEFARLYTILWFTVFFWLTHSLTIENFTIAWIIGVGVSIIIWLLLFTKKYRNILAKWKVIFQKEIIQKQLKYAFWAFLSANAGLVLIQIDQQLIINLLWPTAAGYFTNYLSMISLYTVITTPILWIIFPIVSEIMAKKETSKLEILQNMLYKYFSVFALSIWWLFFILGPEITTVLFGQKFLMSGELLKYSSPFLIIHILFTINFWILAGTGKVKQRITILAIGLLITIWSIMTFISVLKRGLSGAVIGTVMGWIVLWILSFRVINKIQKITFNRGFLLKNIATIFVICIGIWYIKDQYFILEDINRYTNLWYLAIIGIIYYLIIAGVNYPSLRLLKNEIKNIRS